MIETRRCKPSDYFLGAILRGYDREKAEAHDLISCSAIWDRICIECLRTPAGFLTMFAWDTSKAKTKNRIGTIRKVIESGYVPGLAMGQDAKGRAIVVEVQP